MHLISKALHEMRQSQEMYNRRKGPQIEPRGHVTDMEDVNLIEEVKSASLGGRVWRWCWKDWKKIRQM